MVLCAKHLSCKTNTTILDQVHQEKPQKCLPQDKSEIQCASRTTRCGRSFRRIQIPYTSSRLLTSHLPLNSQVPTTTPNPVLRIINTFPTKKSTHPPRACTPQHWPQASSSTRSSPRSSPSQQRCMVAQQRPAPHSMSCPSAHRAGPPTEPP